MTSSTTANGASLPEDDGFLRNDDVGAEEAQPALKNDLLLRSARREKTPRAPVWVMRQAGRYLPEFRHTRSQHDFFEICRTPELACEVTLQPIRRYRGLLDAAIIFSDILVVPQALGMTVEMLPAQGPHFPDPIRTIEHARQVIERPVDVHKELSYVYDAVALTRRRLRGEVPLIGFTGAPWTLFAYMVEGGGSKTFQIAKTWLWDHPDESHVLLSKLADVCGGYLVGQVRAGAQLLQIFDSWAGEMSPSDFATFSLPYLRQISKRVRSQLKSDEQVPMTVFAKGANHAIAELAQSGYDTVGLDWTIEASIARQQADGKVALQGNLDPSLLYASPASIDREVKRMAKSFGTHGWIANLGHGITPGVDPESLRAFLEAVHKHSAA